MNTEFTTMDTFFIKGRGVCHSVEFPATRAGEVRALVGTDITLDGVKRRVEGVECCAVPDSSGIINASFLLKPLATE